MCCLPVSLCRAQRAIGSYMVTTPMGAERHYTLSYGDFRMRSDADAAFKLWFEQVGGRLGWRWGSGSGVWVDG